MSTGSGHMRGAVAARRGIAVSSLVAVAALAAACGSSGNGSSASSTPSSAASSQSPSAGTSSAAPAGSPAVAPASSSSASSGSSGVAACNTADLSVSLQSNAGGGAAGSTYVPIQFTNNSGDPCALYGYPGVSLVTGQNGSQIGAPAKRSGSFAKVNVTVAAHATVHAWLQVAEAGNYPASSCHPVSAHFLKVFPPGNTAPAYVSYSTQTCSSASVVTMTIDPVRTGAAVQGQLP